MLDSPKEQARRRFENLVVAGAFRPVDRFLSDRSCAEDNLQDAICQTYEMDQRYAERGAVLDAAVLVHSCRQRATDRTRRFVKNDAQPARDALHPPNFTTGKVEVHRLEGVLNSDTGGFESEGDRSLELALHHRLTEDPTMNIISAIDLAAWLEDLDVADQNLLAMRMLGFTIEEISESTGLSMSRAFKRLRDLGLELAAHAGLPVLKKPRKPRSDLRGASRDEVKPLDS